MEQNVCPEFDGSAIFVSDQLQQVILVCVQRLLGSLRIAQEERNLLGDQFLPDLTLKVIPLFQVEQIDLLEDLLTHHFQGPDSLRTLSFRVLF